MTHSAAATLTDFLVTANYENGLCEIVLYFLVPCYLIREWQKVLIAPRPWPHCHNCLF